MKQIIFYSWQSDLPNAVNRGFIQGALENAAAAIKADDTVEVEPVVDRDTQGVPGSPDIASTIFSKITAADVFVADVSIIGRSEQRPTPNPNVLIELGYAYKALGHERVILVFNRAFGNIEELPFDLRMRRVLAYDMPADAKEKAPERKALEKQLETAVRAALAIGSARVVQAPSIPAILPIENQTPNRVIVLRRNLVEILTRLENTEPKKHSQGGTVDELLAALNLTQEAVAEFSKIAEIISVMKDTDSLLEVYRWFGSIFEKYNLPENFSGRSSNADQDYFKFIGHELFVILIAFLIREHRWDMLANILREPIPMRYLRREHGPGNVEWSFASEHLPSLLDEAKRRRRVSLHADIINERHTTGGLAAIMPMEEFMAADYFLFLLGELPPENASGFRMDWRPWSTVYMKNTPAFLRMAENKKVAEQLVRIMQIPSIEEFKKRLAERAPGLERLFREGWWDSPITSYDIQRIGTR